MLGETRALKEDIRSAEDAPVRPVQTSYRSAIVSIDNAIVWSSPY